MANQELENFKKNIGGRPPKFKTPEELIQKFVEYVEEVDANPWITESWSKRQRSSEGETSKDAQVFEKKLKRPYTIFGFCNKIGISNWAHFKESYIQRRGFFHSISCIEEFIKNQQITGAMIGEFKENIVSRLNAITEKTEIKAEVKQEKMSEEELQAEYDRLKELFK